jgi:hypothetical protein
MILVHLSWEVQWSRMNDAVVMGWRLFDEFRRHLRVAFAILVRDPDGEDLRSSV